MNKYYKNFQDPSYVKKGTDIQSGPYGVQEDTVFDPRFKVTSKKPYLSEITTRAVIWDYYRVQLALPNESEILKKLGQNIEAVDELLCDARVKAALNNRRAGLLNLKWTLDQNEAPSRVFKTCERIFDTYPVSEIMAEMMMSVFYGFNVTEVIWEAKDGLILPTNLTGKAQRWFVYSDTNELRIKTKAQQVQGEPLPPRKFIVTRYHPRYDDPYAGREALFNACYWPVKFRRIIMQWAMQYLEKYSVPWLDVTMEGGLQQDRLTEIVSTIQKTYQDGIIAHPDNTKIVKMDMDESSSVDNYVKWLDTLNREIDMAILGTNLTSEVKGGSYAAATAHMGVREEIIKEDIRMIEASMDQLIEWIAWYNFPADINLPKFKLFKSEPPTKERAEIDTMTSALGIKLNKEYFSRTYGYNEDEFEMATDSTSVTIGGQSIPVQASSDGSLTIGADDAKVIQDSGIETKDPASNTQTKDAIIAQQKKGYAFDGGSAQSKDFFNFGGPGSGNWGHAGRPGEVGGSGEGGGTAPLRSEPAPTLTTHAPITPVEKQARDKLVKEIEDKKSAVLAIQRKGTPEERMANIKTQLSAIKKEEKKQYDILKDGNRPMTERQAAHDKLEKEIRPQKSLIETAQAQVKGEIKEAVKQTAVEWHKDVSTKAPKDSPSAQFSDKSSKMSVDEIHSSLTEKGISNNIKESYEKGAIDLKTAQEVHASIDHTVTDFGKDKFNQAVSSVVVEDHKGNAMAFYQYGDRHIGINSKYSSDGAHFEGRLEEMNILERNEASSAPWLSTSSVKAVMDHEIGHAFTHFNKDEITKSVHGSSRVDLNLGRLVSEYATTNKDEFYAEVFSAGRNGIQLHEKIQPYYNAVINNINK